ncbi:MAG: hypothetical protein KGJ57_17410 [Sphingomonadales bacterium]|nr:hypothetical protein [Sphingomonadales bacterium]MDE2171176.1 hypothetical protein [Sphingomonadales bacterium]
MTEDERRAKGRTRRLAFQNLANGVPMEKICTDLRLSALEVEQAQAFVCKKITERLVMNRQPPIPCQGLREIRWNRRGLLGVLAMIGDLDLSTDLILARITVQAFDHPEMIEGASRRMKEASAK